jgi:cyclase
MSLGPLEPELREVCEDVYAYLQPDGSWYLNNTGFLVNETGVISVDATSTERRTRAYLDAIATVTENPCAPWSTPITTATIRTAIT